MTLIIYIPCDKTPTLQTETCFKAVSYISAGGAAKHVMPDTKSCEQPQENAPGGNRKHSTWPEKAAKHWTERRIDGLTS